MKNATELSTASAGEAFTYGMPETSALVNLLARWEARSRDASPVDAMLVNKHIRELRETLAASPAPGRAPLTDERDTFETHLRSLIQDSDLRRHADGEYLAAPVQCHWQGWQARAALAKVGIATAGGIGGE